MSDIVLTGQSARTCSRCRAPPTCSRPRRPASPPERKSTARSTTRPTTSPRPGSMPAPATSAICSTASATACRCCRPPTPASPRCRSWSILPSRSPTRRCSSRRATAPSPALHSPARAPASPAGPATAADLTTSKLNGGVFTFTSAAGTAVTITIGTAASPFNSTSKTATVKTLDQLNTALAVAGVNLSASITNTDELTFTSTNDGAAQTITGTAAATAPTALDAINISANALGGCTGGTVVASFPMRCRKPA